ncbi:MAG: DNA polymerase III subunit gamma/tau [Acidobacteria bacterium]|nr:DNA polymerase III subunit gamma/tau [Acidobacteriota bacterium]
MYQVIARKYRPQTFAELVNQQHVRTTLENAIAQNRIAHGYIFSGQRGTGKTTVARILARCLNCVLGPTAAPCGKCESCAEIGGGGALDVIEIDAASNRGINEMRELRESVRYRPARDRYKVFIIDEAHQITSEAFNALLKTLEEPPGWVVFVLCTTEAHKIPATIASRCQHFSFRSVDFEELVARLEWICQQEGIAADAETLAVLAQVGEGSVRDSLSALDQAIAHCGTELKAAEVRALLGVFSLERLGQVTSALQEANSARMLELVDELVRNGHHLQHFCRELARYFRNLLVARIAGRDTRVIAASGQERERLASLAASFSEQDLTRYLQLTLDLFRDLQYSLQPRLHLEVGLIRLVEAGRLLPIEQALASLGGAPGQTSPPPAPPTGQTKAAPTLFSEAAQAQPSGAWKERLCAAFAELGMKFSADAVEHSEVVESGGVLEVRTPKDYALSMRPADVEKALKHLGGDRRKVRITFVETAAAVGPPPAPEQQDDMTRRALEHPEVQRFREVFPDAEVRGVRSLQQ